MNERDLLTIRTPEGITFSLTPATPVTRFLAWVIDLFCVIILTNLISLLLMWIQIINVDLGRAVTIVGYFILSVGYAVFLEWFWRGRTIGKKVLRLQVIDERGLRLQFSQVLIRNLMRYVDSIPFTYLVGGIAAVVNARGRRLGDFAANTLVIRKRDIGEPDLDEIMEEKYNSLRQYPHIAARLRNAVTPEFASLMLRAIIRRNELYPDARVEVFAEIAGHLRTLVDFPEEAAAGISDERLVRNTVEILYRQKK